MRPVYVIAGGITKFAKANPAKDFRLMVKEAFDFALADLDGKLTPAEIDGSVISYFSDHFTRQLKAGAMVQDFVGLCPKPHERLALTLEDVMRSEYIAWPLKRHDICVMSDGAAVCILASEKAAEKFCRNPIRITGIGAGSDCMRFADRPHGQVPLLPHEKKSDYKYLKY